MSDERDSSYLLLPIALQKTLENLSRERGVEGVLVVDDEGFPLQSTLKTSHAEALAAHVKSVSTEARRAANELNLGKLLFVIVDFVNERGEEKQIVIATEEDMYLCVLRRKF
ncbi:MAG: roadblock/LC7 domain-containing protein [Candidatus Baldrarchaeia archaeon]|mgnify:CR=1 FL=1